MVTDKNKQTKYIAQNSKQASSAIMTVAAVTWLEP